MSQHDINSDQESKLTIERKLTVSQNYPNPFSADESTTITYRAIGALDVSLVFYNAKGKRVLLLEKLIPGSGQVIIHGNQLPPGAYTYALAVNGRIIGKKKMEIVLKTIQ